MDDFNFLYTSSEFPEMRIRMNQVGASFFLKETMVLEDNEVEEKVNGLLNGNTETNDEGERVQFSPVTPEGLKDFPFLYTSQVEESVALRFTTESLKAFAREVMDLDEAQTTNLINDITGGATIATDEGEVISYEPVETIQ